MHITQKIFNGIHFYSPFVKTFKHSNLPLAVLVIDNEKVKNNKAASTAVDNLCAKLANACHSFTFNNTKSVYYYFTEDVSTFELFEKIEEKIEECEVLFLRN